MIVVTAPTGQIGQKVLASLLDGDQPVRVIVRDPARLTPQARERAEVVTGSHGDPGVLTAAFTGADAVLWLVPPNPGADNIHDHYLDFTRPACEAFTAQGVRRVVSVSSLGHHFGERAGLLSFAFAMDALIESSGVNHRALAMPFFMENLLHQAEAITTQGMFFLPNSEDRPLAAVATRDIAAAAVGLLTDDTWSGQGVTPVIGDSLAPAEMAQVMTEVLERPVRCRQIDEQTYKATLLRYGMSEAWAQGMVDMAVAQNDGIYDKEWEALLSPAPTSFRQWCQEVLEPALRR